MLTIPCTFNVEWIPDNLISKNPSGKIEWWFSPPLSAHGNIEISCPTASNINGEYPISNSLPPYKSSINVTLPAVDTGVSNHIIKIRVPNQPDSQLIVSVQKLPYIEYTWVPTGTSKSYYGRLSYQTFGATEAYLNNQKLTTLSGSVSYTSTDITNLGQKVVFRAVSSTNQTKEITISLPPPKSIPPSKGGGQKGGGMGGGDGRK